MRTAPKHVQAPTQLPALRPPTPAQIATVTEGLEHKWSHNALAIQDRLTQAVEAGDASAAQKWAISGGISTEKVLLMKGRPTEITGHLHAHRHDVSRVLDKLASALRPGMTTSARSVPSVADMNRVTNVSDAQIVPSVSAMSERPVLNAQIVSQNHPAN